VSAVWNYDATSGVLTPQWIDTDQSTPNVYLVADSITGRLIITGDVSALNAGFGGTWVPVSIRVVVPP